MGKAEEDFSLENWMEAPAANTTARGTTRLLPHSCSIYISATFIPTIIAAAAAVCCSDANVSVMELLQRGQAQAVVHIGTPNTNYVHRTRLLRFKSAVLTTHPSPPIIAHLHFRRHRLRGRPRLAMGRVLQLCAAHRFCSAVSASITQNCHERHAWSDVVLSMQVHAGDRQSRSKLPRQQQFLSNRRQALPPPHPPPTLQQHLQTQNHRNRTCNDVTTVCSAGECSVPYAMRFTGGRHASTIVKGGVDPASLCAALQSKI
jgi:hypothetical protein